MISSFYTFSRPTQVFDDDDTAFCLSPSARQKPRYLTKDDQRLLDPSPFSIIANPLVAA